MNLLKVINSDGSDVASQSSQLGNFGDSSNVATEKTSNSLIPSPTLVIPIPSSSLPTVVVTSPKESTSSNRFSNPKKDLVKYLERKSEVTILKL